MRELFDWTMATTSHHGPPFPAAPPGIITPQHHTANPNLTSTQVAPRRKEENIWLIAALALGIFFGIIALACFGAWIYIITCEHIYGPLIYADVEFEYRHLNNTMSSITSRMLIKFLERDNITISISGTRVEDGSSYYLTHYSNITMMLTTVPALTVFSRVYHPVTTEFVRYKLLYQSLLAIDILMNPSLITIKSK